TKPAAAPRSTGGSHSQRREMSAHCGVLVIPRITSTTPTTASAYQSRAVHAVSSSAIAGGRSVIFSFLHSRRGTRRRHRSRARKRLFQLCALLPREAQCSALHHGFELCGHGVERAFIRLDGFSESQREHARREPRAEKHRLARVAG